MNYVSVKKGFIDKLKTLFPNVTFYAGDVVEGYQRPCMFTKLIIVSDTSENYNSERINASFIITYLQEYIDEVDMLNAIDSIKDSFRLGFTIETNNESKFINVFDIDTDLVGPQGNVLQVTIDCVWLNDIAHASSSSDNISNIRMNGSVDYQTDLED